MVNIQPKEFRELLEEAIRVDAYKGRSFYLNLHVKDEVLTITPFEAQDEADSQRELIIDTLVELYTNALAVHDVRMDNTSNDLVRLTCHTEGCNQATLVWQPFMSELQWHQAIAEYKEKHPTPKFGK